MQHALTLKSGFFFFQPEKALKAHFGVLSLMAGSGCLKSEERDLGAVFKHAVDFVNEGR